MSDQTTATSGHEAPNTAATAPITVEQAAAILGVSVTTIKRRIRAGSLRAEQAHRPQGTVWLVYLPAAATAATDERPPAASVVATAAATTPQAEAMVSLIQTTIATVLGPLVGQIDAQRQTIERQADQLVSQAEALGRVTAERDAAQATVASILAQQTVPPPSEAPSPRWRPWWRWVVALALLALTVALLAWPG